MTPPTPDLATALDDLEASVTLELQYVQGLRRQVEAGDSASALVLAKSFARQVSRTAGLNAYAMLSFLSIGKGAVLCGHS